MSERLYACPHGHVIARRTEQGAWLLSVCNLCNCFAESDHTPLTQPVSKSKSVTANPVTVNV